MTTYYVNSQTSNPNNGYGVGSDSNNGTSIATPFLTHTKAASTAISGDTVHINGGVAGGAAPAYISNLYLNITQATITYIGDGLSPIIQPGDLNSQAVRVRSTVTGTLTLTNLTFDAQSNRNYCYKDDSGGTGYTAVITNCTFINASLQALNPAYYTSLTLNGCTITQNVAAGSGIYLDSNIAGATATIQNCTFTQLLATQTVLGLIRVAPQASAQPKVTITGNTLTASLATGAFSHYGIYAGACLEFVCTNNTITVTAFPNTSTSIDGINYNSQVLTTVTTNRCVVTGNTITCADSAGVAPGHSIAVGDDLDTTPTGGANRIKGILIAQNVVNHPNHAIFIGWVSGALVWGNSVTSATIGVIGKHTGSSSGAPSIFCGNLIQGIQAGNSAYAMYSKGGSGDIYCNNTYINTTANGGWFMFVGVAASNIVFKNNLMYATSQVAQGVSVANDGSTATFFTNSYGDNGNGFTSTAFVYQATTYSTLALWGAAQETTYLNVTPVFSNYSAGDYRVPPSNTSLYLKGTYAHAWAVDYRGRPFWVPPTIGCYEVTSKDAVMARSVRH